jgi:hypothetical protein
MTLTFKVKSLNFHKIGQICIINEWIWFIYASENKVIWTFFLIKACVANNAIPSTYQKNDSYSLQFIFSLNVYCFRWWMPNKMKTEFVFSIVYNKVLRYILGRRLASSTENSLLRVVEKFFRYFHAQGL